MTRECGAPRRVACIGMGEFSSTVVEGWGKERDFEVRAFDVRSADPEKAAEMDRLYTKLGVRGCKTLAGSIAGAEIILCAVTPDQAIAAASAAAPAVEEGQFWCDLNSSAPGTKRRAGELIESGGARYVDGAVMAPVARGKNMVPLLLSGPHAESAAARLALLPMAPRALGGEVGAASAIKMIRSVMVKGQEALSAECFLAAVAAGVEREVIEWLRMSDPATDWPERTEYRINRSMTHGRRRAAEMEEVAKTLRELGVPGEMSAAAANWQSRMAAAAEAHAGPRPSDLRGLAALALSGIAGRR